MTPHPRTVIAFVALSVAGLVLAAGVAPRLSGSEQMLLTGLGCALFGSALTSFLIAALARR